ncbi:STAS-like domain-containing protein [Faecalibacterium sp. I3-3-89]|jgi:hypothetical protein|uniref:STAS-like domain-containing protein n=1 Tax=Faecalibacterium sp. I3-3-89 TaxID=2929493 RepID=UPI002014C2CD|nr:DUF4325 domain-containing protein [Faecalibacterium sp. I3-3-89]UQK44201.1 DUF4325 domain-containing protein [Faecalibacterium sp. I3-3-89]
MTEQKVALEIRDRSLTKLAGNSYGRKLFSEQVDGKIDLDQPFTIEFPEQIDYLASSFIQGFFGKIYTEIGREGMEKNFDIIAPKIDNPKKVILDRLMLM